MHNRQWNLGIALFFIAASLLAIFVWIPLDTETGLIVEERRSTVVGDALAPTAAAVAILLTSLALFIASLLRGRDAPASEAPIGVTQSNLISFASILAVFVVSFTVMTWAGPVTVKALQIAGVNVPEYRLLTSTVPYKYIGFALGGFLLVCGLISWIEGRISLRACAIAVAAVLVLIGVYDLPFDSLLLPPNGSQ